MFEDVRTVYCVAVAIFILSLLLNCISISMRGTVQSTDSSQT